MKVFVDTCAICAAIVPSDTNCQKAQSLFLWIEQQRATMVTSDYVLAELYTLLNVRSGHHTAVAYMDAFKKSGIKLLSAFDICPQADAIFRKYNLPRLSYVDCTSFALVNAHRLDHLFSFDAHFSQFRFNHTVTILN